MEGVGTPAPIAPTERLVIGGAYRYVRNPMYLAVAALIFGQAFLFGQARLLLYAAAFCVTVAAFVHGYEEPLLSRRFLGSTRPTGARFRRGGPDGRPGSRRGNRHCA